MGEQFRGMWGELRRRRVVSTAAAYAAVSFVLLQLGEILFPAFDLGPGALRILLALLLALFPIVLALSWVYDVTAAGLQRTDDLGESGRPSAILMGGVLVSALLLGWMGWWGVRSVETAGGSALSASIAVLPFLDMSAAGDQAYLGDGLAEEVLNVLAQVEGLQVAARTSSFAFRDNRDIREIGTSLNVATVLEGSVRRDSLTVRVTAQLIDSQSGFHVWSNTYDREVGGLFAVQDEIAQAIAEALLGKLDVVVGTGARRAVSAEAQEAYWKGREQWNRRDAVGLPEAIRLFNRAIEIDSLYPQAYAGLADSWALLPKFMPSLSGDEALARAEDFARQAIALDADLAEPHASLGLVLALRRDRLGALGEFGRALQINPSYAAGRHWRANVLAEMGRLGEALDDARQAATIDRLSPAIATDLGNIMLWSGDYEGAQEEFERAKRLDFGFRSATLGMALVALAAEEPVGLQMALTEWAAISAIPTSTAADLGTGMLAYRGSGSPQPVPVSLTTLERSGRVDAGTLASLHALLGDVPGTLLWLSASLADGSWIDQYAAVNPVYDLLRGEPAFADFLVEVGE